jgi:Predicted outer membrane protein
MKGTFIYFGIAMLAISGLSACAKNTYSTNTSNTNSSISNSEYGSTSNTAYGNSMNTMGNSRSDTSNTDQASAADDNDFMTEAAQGGMAEVELGKLAASKATSPEVKKFGQQMVTDHTKANNDLKALAAKKGMKLPAEVDSEAKSTMEDLKGRTGADFDKEYVENMYEDHKKDVADFQDEAKNASDPDVKAFASKTLPTLQKHLDMITAIRDKMK